jgi:hypothetical protein
MKTTHKIVTVLVTLALSGAGLSCFGHSGDTAQQPGRITGAIVDARTGEPVWTASVQLVGTKLGAMTDRDGHFFIKGVPPGRYALRISSIEYDTLSLDSVTVRAGESTEVNGRLNMKEIDLHNDPIVLPEKLPDSGLNL